MHSTRLDHLAGAELQTSPSSCPSPPSPLSAPPAPVPPESSTSTWQSEPFTTYHIEESTGLTTWTTTIPWAGTTGYQTSLSLPSPAATAPKRFYRILRE